MKYIKIFEDIKNVKIFTLNDIDKNLSSNSYFTYEGNRYNFIENKEFYNSYMQHFVSKNIPNINVYMVAYNELLSYDSSYNNLFKSPSYNITFTNNNFFEIDFFGLYDDYFLLEVSSLDNGHRNTIYLLIDGENDLFNVVDKLNKSFYDIIHKIII